MLPVIIGLVYAWICVGLLMFLFSMYAIHLAEKALEKDNRTDLIPDLNAVYSNQVMQYGLGGFLAICLTLGAIVVPVVIYQRLRGR